MAPDAILFDVDDTLCRYRRSGAALLAAAFDRTDHEPFITVEEYHDRYPEFVDDSDSMGTSGRSASRPSPPGSRVVGRFAPSSRSPIRWPPCSRPPAARPFRGLPPVGLAARVSSLPLVAARGSLRSPLTCPRRSRWSRLAPPARSVRGLPPVGRAGYDPSVGRRVAAAYADERDHGNVEPLAGVDEALSALSDLPLGVVTNGAPAMHAAKLAALGLGEAFDVVVHGGYDAPAKPSPVPFQRALSSLDASPGWTYHVGNSLSSDVAGARAASVQAVWLADGTARAEPEPDHTVDALADVPRLLDDD